MKNGRGETACFWNSRLVQMLAMETLGIPESLDYNGNPITTRLKIDEQLMYGQLEHCLSNTRKTTWKYFISNEPAKVPKNQSHS